MVNAAEVGMQIEEMPAWTEQQGTSPALDPALDIAQTILLSGTLSYDSSIDHPFLKSLPCFIHVSTQGDRVHGEILIYQ